MEYKYTKAELLALDPEPYSGEIEFADGPLPGIVLWVQADGFRCYNLGYTGGGKDGISVHNLSDMRKKEATHAKQTTC